MHLLSVVLGALAGVVFAFYSFGGGGLTEVGLEGKRVVVCGASEGIGKEIALAYAREGAEVVLIARRKSVLEGVGLQAMRRGAKAAHVVPADLGSEEGLRHAHESALTHLGGGVDTLILNHVIGYVGNFTQDPTPYRTLERLFRVNALSYMDLALRFLPALEESGGAIGVVSSVAGQVGLPYIAPYSATKHSLHGFFNSLRHDLRRGGRAVSITMTTLGAIATENAVKNSAHVFENVEFLPVADAARTIVQATERRVRDAYYPFWEARATVILDALCPTLLDTILQRSL